MAIVKETNTICRHCGKAYYACYHCLKKQNWRSICCSLECYEKYSKEILESRGETIVIPKRTDMTQEEVKDFIKNTSEEDAIAKTKEELIDYIEENPDDSIIEIVDKVNKDIKSKNKGNK